LAKALRELEKDPANRNIASLLEDEQLAGGASAFQAIIDKILIKEAATPSSLSDSIHERANDEHASISNPLGLLAEASDSIRDTSKPPPSSRHAELPLPTYLFSASLTADISLAAFGSTAQELGIHIPPSRLRDGLASVTEPRDSSEVVGTGAGLDYFRDGAGWVKRDVSDDLDAVNLGLVTMEEAVELFEMYTPFPPVLSMSSEPLTFTIQIL
jgi:hypothetical protein